MIYGVATLAVCMLLGMLMGTAFGTAIGIGGEVGGVGFAMLFFIFVTNSKKLRFTEKEGFVRGVSFWKAMFIPVVIAMTATQDVYHMLSGSIVAIAAGVGAVLFSFGMLYVLKRIDTRRRGE